MPEVIVGCPPAEAQRLESLRKLNSRRSLLFGIPGLLFQGVLGGVQVRPASAGRSAVVLDQSVLGLLVVGVVAMFSMGMAYAAKAKGRSPWWGLLGLGSLPGLLALLFLPNLCGRCGSACSFRSRRCSCCGAPV